MGVGQVLTMPLFFASNCIPVWRRKEPSPIRYAPVAFSQKSGRLGEIVLFMDIVIMYDPKERAKILQETL
jgi:hypothetical protein